MPRESVQQQQPQLLEAVPWFHFKTFLSLTLTLPLSLSLLLITNVNLFFWSSLAILWLWHLNRFSIFSCIRKLNPACHCLWLWLLVMSRSHSLSLSLSSASMSWNAIIFLLVNSITLTLKLCHYTVEWCRPFTRAFGLVIRHDRPSLYFPVASLLVQIMAAQLP